MMYQVVAITFILTIFTLNVILLIVISQLEKSATEDIFPPFEHNESQATKKKKRSHHRHISRGTIKNK